MDSRRAAWKPPEERAAPYEAWVKPGAHQVPGARTALGHAYGGGSQFFSMRVVSSQPR